jgi:lipopolysaccharide export system permease protein
MESSLPLYLKDSTWGKTGVQKRIFTSIASAIPDSLEQTIIQHIAVKISNLKSQAELLAFDDKEISKEIRLHRMEQHRKFSLSLACIIFFLIGAPLGTITRKGGLGLPLVISVFFFILFHVINTSGEKMVKEGVLYPYAGMWLSASILIPVGLFLMQKARKDAQPFQQEKFSKLWSAIRALFRKKTSQELSD